MNKLLLLRTEVEESFGLTRTDIEKAEANGLLTAYDGPEKCKWKKYHLAEVRALVADRGDELLKRTDVEEMTGCTRDRILRAVREGDLKVYAGPLEKRYHQFHRKDVEGWMDRM